MKASTRDKLREAGQRRLKANAEATAASNALRALIRTARAEGVGPTEIAALTGLSRQAVYDMLA